MPKNKEQQEQENLHDVVLSQALGGGQSEIQQQLATLLLKRLSKQDADEEETIRLRAAARKAGMDAQLKGREQELLKQSQCAHKKPYGEPATAGQRLHSNHYQWLCQYCAKEWIDSELPIELRIDSTLVGGPNF